LRFSWSRPRRFGPIVGLVIVTVMLVAVPASQQRTQKAAAAAASASGTSASQLLLIDPLTGKPREATTAELEQLRQSQADVTVTPPEPIVSADGMQGLRLSDDQMVYSVATKNPDGTIRFGEAVGPRAAKRIVTGGAPVLVVTKEKRDDR
jgi:hypothetical protein